MANIVDSIVGVLASSKHVIVSSDLTGNTAVSSTHPLITIKNNNQQCRCESNNTLQNKAIETILGIDDILQG